MTIENIFIDDGMTDTYLGYRQHRITLNNRRREGGSNVNLHIYTDLQ